MSTRSQFERLGDALPPMAAVVAWLERAHASGSAGAYVAEQAGLPRYATDPHKLMTQIRRDVERTSMHESRATINKTILKAMGAVCLRVDLVATLEDETASRHRFQQLEQELLAYQAVILLDEANLAGSATAGVWADRPGGLAALRAAFVLRARSQLLELFEADAVRGIIERRYLAGHQALFPATAAEEDLLLSSAIKFVETAEFVAADGPLDGGPTIGPVVIPDLRLSALRELAQARAPAAAARLVEEARISVFRSIGEDERADRLEDRLRRTAYAVRRTPDEPESPPNSESP
jgi:hypothetical protein